MRTVLRPSPGRWYPLVARVARVDRLPAWSWPLAVALAAWPVATGVAGRLFDDSGDFLGLVALGALGLVLWQARERFRCVALGGHLAIAAALVVASDLSGDALPESISALLACIAVVFALAAIADRDEPIVPYAGLAVLSLPLLSSLQLHIGDPLRVVTAEASRWLLAAAGFVVERAGSALTVDGYRVLVDAPCVGLQLAWVGCFAACVVAWMFGVSNRALVARLPGVGATVLVVDVVRATVLVAADVEGVVMTDAMHAAVRMLSICAIACVVALLVARARPAKAADASSTSARPGRSIPERNAA